VQPLNFKHLRAGKMSLPGDLMLSLNAAEMNAEQTTSSTAHLWQKTQFSNLNRYVPSGIYFARFHAHGKLFRKSLKTDVLCVARLRLADLEKFERRSFEAQTNAARGNPALDEPSQAVNGSRTSRSKPGGISPAAARASGKVRFKRGAGSAKL
jgi:hypothetical protein